MLITLNLHLNIGNVLNFRKKNPLLVDFKYDKLIKLFVKILMF